MGDQGFSGVLSGRINSGLCCPKKVKRDRAYILEIPRSFLIKNRTARYSSLPHFEA
jgi:hypothetical protein